VLIDRHMPTFDVSERHSTVVDAPAERTYEAVRGVDLAGSRLVRALFAARGLPALLRRSRDRGAGRVSRMSLDDLVRAGFVWLEDSPPEEMVLGIVGAFWTPRGGVKHVPAQAFDAFDEPGLAKAVWNFRVVPDGERRSFLTTETRVRVPDDAARKRFLLYWSVVGPFSATIRKRALALVAASAGSAEPGTMDGPEGGST
jgi:hypothetical protein